MEKKGFKLGFLIFLICTMGSILAVTVSGAFFYANSQFMILSGITQLLINKYPQDEQEIINLIKENSGIYYNNQINNDNYLTKYGFQAEDFSKEYMEKLMPSIIIIVVILMGLQFLLLFVRKKRERERIGVLTKYLEQLNLGQEVTILPNREDALSCLQDELYKTVTTLYQTREEAIAVKENYADNLANIAHQMKTPLTAMSLLTQLLKDELQTEYVEQLLKQIERLTRLEEALLLLSRIDAGVLRLEKENVDVYTMLLLAVEGLEEISICKNLEIKLENNGEVFYAGDMEWSIEAFSNLIKNCMEYAKSRVTIEYLQNPLYTEIKIWDDGEGFTKQDISHIFERFYRGQRAKEGGVGIGLTLAKSLIIMQNGCIEAINYQETGACFVVRFYCH